MLKELLSGQVRAGILKVEMEGLPEPPCDAELAIQVKDTVHGEGTDTCLHVEVCRTVEFVPRCNYALQVTYFVEHALRENGTLAGLSPQQIREEIDQDPRFFAQEALGFVHRISLLIGQATSTFGGVPIMLPPQLQL